MIARLVWGWLSAPPREPSALEKGLSLAWDANELVETALDFLPEAPDEA